jgi:plastocyanin
VRAGRCVSHLGAGFSVLPRLDQTETWTVALAPGTYRFNCDVFPPMKGALTVTP